MTTTGTWYPPSAGTGGFLLMNPPFAPMTHPTPMIQNLTLCARQRAHFAAADGDIPRYWRELAAARRLAGWFDSASDSDRMASRA